MAAIVLGPNSTSLWIISPPDLDRLKQDLANNVTLKVSYKYAVSRTTNTEKIAGTLQSERSFDLLPDDTESRPVLLNMLNKIGGQKPAQLKHLFPKFLKVKTNSCLKFNVEQIFSIFNASFINCR